VTALRRTAPYRIADLWPTLPYRNPNSAPSNGPSRSQQTRSCAVSSRAPLTDRCRRAGFRHDRRTDIDLAAANGLEIDAGGGDNSHSLFSPRNFYRKGNARSSIVERDFDFSVPEVSLLSPMARYVGTRRFSALWTRRSPVDNEIDPAWSRRCVRFLSRGISTD
jgi:hypothetical protein